MTPVMMITGVPKSGTTWLNRLLDAHPALLSPGEGRFFGRTLVTPRTGARSLEATLRESDALRAWLRTSGWTRGSDVDEELRAATAAVTLSVLKRRLEEAGKQIAVDKTPLPDEHYVADLHRVLPEASVIHVIRDGRDVAISSLYHVWRRADKGFDVPSWMLAGRDECRSDPAAYLREHGSIFPTPGWLEAYAERWHDWVGATREDGRRLLGARYAEVRYEDLHDHAERELARLAQFMGVDDSERVLARCMESASFERLSGGRSPGEDDPRSFFRKGIAGEWRSLFGEEDVRLFDRVAGALLTDMGYELGAAKVR